MNLVILLQLSLLSFLQIFGLGLTCPNITSHVELPYLKYDLEVFYVIQNSKGKKVFIIEKLNRCFTISNKVNLVKIKKPFRSTIQLFQQDKNSSIQLNLFEIRDYISRKKIPRRKFACVSKWDTVNGQIFKTFVYIPHVKKFSGHFKFVVDQRTIGYRSFNQIHPKKSFYKFEKRLNILKNSTVQAMFCFTRGDNNCKTLTIKKCQHSKEISISYVKGERHKTLFFKNKHSLIRNGLYFIPPNVTEVNIGESVGIRIPLPSPPKMYITRIKDNKSDDIILVNVNESEYPCDVAKFKKVRLCKLWSRCIRIDTNNLTYSCQIKGNSNIGGFVMNVCNNSVDFMKSWKCPKESLDIKDTKMIDIKSMNKSSRQEFFKDVIGDLNDKPEVSELDQARHVIDTLYDEKDTFANDSDKEIMDTLNTLADSMLTLVSKKLPWAEIHAYSVAQTATDITLAIEKPAMVLASRMTATNAPISIQNEKLDLRISPIQKQVTDFIPRPFNNTQDRFQLSLLSLPKDVVSVVFAKYNDIADVIIGPNSSVVTNIISATLSKYHPVKVTFRLYHINPQSTGGKFGRKCSYWNQSDDGDGWLWSEDGCKVVSAESPFYTECECNHLSSFAVLTDYSGVTGRMSTMHQKIMSITTYFGCALTIIFLILFILFISFVGVFSLAQFNLALCLLIGNIFFLGGIWVTHNPLACSIVAGFLHYSFLAAFVWKLIFGMNALRLITSTHNITDLMVKWKWQILAGGYLTPAFIVALTAGLRYDDYGSKDICWVSNVRGAQWAFIGPIIVVLTLNLIAIIIIAVLLLKNYCNNIKNKINKSNHLVVLIQLSLTMGLPWIVGLFLFDATAGVVFSYIFIISNALQGFLLFVLVAIVNDENRGHLKAFLLKRVVGTDDDLKRTQSRNKLLHSRSNSSNSSRSTRLTHMTSSHSGHSEEPSSRVSYGGKIDHSRTDLPEETVAFLHTTNNHHGNRRRPKSSTKEASSYNSCPTQDPDHADMEPEVDLYPLDPVMIKRETDI